ncbi:hypothetical protein EVAR_62333_1 [Eumeta japonica]|uniref:Uncharacterized protein n=1 Tax=Eumeta variegata TaxID=151549 RepID=A0A4C1Z7B0_EUMVA|nr:hypothetical protein EVAR_62333_1 [Eumeta japonica]
MCVDAAKTTLHELSPVNSDRFPETEEWINSKYRKVIKTQNAPGYANLAELTKIQYRYGRIKDKYGRKCGVRTMLKLGLRDLKPGPGP